MSDFFRILAIFLLILGNAIFVAAEYALVTARRTRLEPEAERGSMSARKALHLMDHPVGFISTAQIGITVFAIALGSVGEPLISGYFDPYVSNGIAYFFAFLILTYLSVALGELVPKSIALQRAEPIARFVALPLGVLQRFTRPFVWALQIFANMVTRLFGVTPAPAGELAHTEEDIRHIVAGAEDAGVIATT
jgi:putative hemolysin